MPHVLPGATRVWYTDGVDVQTWTTLSRLLDEALDLPPAARTTWLEGLSAEYEAFKPRLREMLEQASLTGDAAFLDTLPKLREAWVTDGGGAALHPGRAGALVGPYRLLREIASGGQGAVWLADRPDGLVNRQVAIKLPIGFAYRAGLAERLARERDILASLSHPHIARLYDAGFTDSGEPYLALEYVEGQAIDRYCEAARLGVEARVRLMLQVMEAVAYAHARLVIHRDLKPSNVLVTTDGAVRLLDFGIARLLDESTAADATVTGAGGRAMTLAYASPEQVAQAPLGVGTDVYSLGVMLYELLTGARPYRPARDTAAALEDAILSGEPVRPSDAARDPAVGRRLRGDLDAILLKALAKDPADRYVSVTAFADDLTRYVDGRPVVAQPDSPVYRIRKFVRRNRLAVGAAAAITAAVLGGAGVALWQAGVARAEQRRAERAMERAEAVKDFIASIFKDVDPNLRGSGRPLTAADVLEMARDRVDRELGSQPAERVELQRILGDSLLGIGAFERGADVLTAAAAESERLYGPDAEETVETRLLLAAARQYESDTSPADAALDQVEASLGRTGRLDSEAFVRAKLLRVGLMLNHGQAVTPEAEAAGREALEAAERILPPSHRLRADAFDSLASIYRFKGRAELGFEFAEKAYFAALSAYGQDPKHPRVIAAQNVYGRALFEMDRTADAVRHLKEAAANGEDVYRENGLYVQHLFGTLANIQQAYGEIGPALDNLRKASAADIGEITLPPSYVAGQHAAIARVLLAARRYGEAEPEYTQAIALLRTGSNANATRVFQVEHAAALMGLGRSGEARAMIQPLITDAPPRTLADRHALVVLAQLERQAGRLDRATALLDRANDESPRNPRVRALMAVVAMERGRIALSRRDSADAHAAFEQAEAMRTSVEGVMTPVGADIRIGLGQVALAEGHAADAIAAFEEARDFWRAFAPDHADARDAEALLARARALH
ncbi:MAG: protein kinase [Vicinamibacterales bacterium]